MIRIGKRILGINHNNIVLQPCTVGALIIRIWFRYIYIYTDYEYNIIKEPPK